MRPTRRGYALAGIVIGAEVLALTYGGRALNAIVAPAVVALAAGAIAVARADTPTVDRASVPPGFPGDSREVTVEVTGSGAATVVETVPDGLAVDASTHERALPTTFTYEVTLEERGRHTLGPLVVRVTDLLGLVSTTVETEATTDVLVYPPVSPLSGHGAVLGDVVDPDAVERQEFESVREYVPGDPLRAVHWKSTAKDPDGMYVTEFVDSSVEDSIVLAAGSAPGYADEMAAAAASVAVTAVDAGVGVELRTPSGVVSRDSGADHRDRLLRHLALAEGGPLPDVERVDVRIYADCDGVVLTVGSRDHDFEALTVGGRPETTPEVSP